MSYANDIHRKACHVEKRGTTSKA